MVSIVRLQLVFILICTCLIPAHARTEVRNTPGNMHVNSFAQDGRGYIWIATAKGLCRYNGYEYVIYYHSDDDPRSLPSDMVRILYIDRDDYLWIGTDKGYCRYDHELDVFTVGGYSTPGELPSYINGFVEEKDRLLIYGMNGVKEVDRDGMTCRNIETTRDMVVTTMTATDGDGYLIGTNFGQGLYHVDNHFDIFKLLHHDGQLEYNCSFRYSQGEYWLGTNKGIQRCYTDGASGLKCEFIGESSMLPVTFIHRADPWDLYDDSGGPCRRENTYRYG